MSRKNRKPPPPPKATISPLPHNRHDLALALYIAERFLLATEPAKLERSSKQYSKDMETALGEVLDALSEGLGQLGTPGASVDLGKIRRSLMHEMELQARSLSDLNGARGRDVEHQTELRI